MHATVNTSSKAKVEGECGSVMLCRQGAGAAILFFFRDSSLRRRGFMLARRRCDSGRCL